jgi:hypothetical protein
LLGSSPLRLRVRRTVSRYVRQRVQRKPLAPISSNRRRQRSATNCQRHFTARVEASPPVNECLRAGVSQADARYAKTLKVDSSLSFRGAGSTRYDDGSLLIVWTGVDCTAWLRIRGPVSVDPTWSAITVGPGAEFAAHDEGPTGKRDYVVGPGGSASLSVNGAPVALGAEHRDWTAMMVLEYVRRTGLDAGGAHAPSSRGTDSRRFSTRLARFPESRFARSISRRHSPRWPRPRPAFIHDAASLLDSALCAASSCSPFRASGAQMNECSRLHTPKQASSSRTNTSSVAASRSTAASLPAALKPLVEHLIASLQSVERRTALRGYYLDVRP